MAFLNVNGSSSPQIEVSFDWQNDPTSGTTTWTDITPYVVSYSRQPVRSNEFDQPGPAAATLVLRNDDARFTPDNASSPYAGGLKKYRRFRVRAQWNSVIYNRFWGYVVDWPQSWAMAGKDQTVALQLVDNLFPLTTFDLFLPYDPTQPGGGQRHFPSASSGSAIGAILDPSGITSYSLDAGLSTIADSGTLTTTGAYALQRIQNISASENGVCFADGGGTIRFHDRAHRTNVATVSGTIGDSSGEVRYIDPQPQYGEVWPIVNVTPYGGSVQSATVTAGTASYFQQTLNYPTGGQYLVSDVTEAQNAADYIANRYSAPVTRVNSVTLIGARDSSLWPAILGLDTSSRVLFRRRFLDNGTIGGTIETQQFVEGYGDVVTVGQDWRVQVPLSPVDIQSYWVLGTSALGETTALFY